MTARISEPLLNGSFVPANETAPEPPPPDRTRAPTDPGKPAPLAVGLAPLPVAEKAKTAIKAPGRTSGERAVEKRHAKLDSLLAHALHNLPFGVDRDQLETWRKSQSADTLLGALVHGVARGDAHAPVWLDEMKKQIDSALIKASAHAAGDAPLRGALLALRSLCRDDALTEAQHAQVKAARTTIMDRAPQIVPHVQLLFQLATRGE